MTGSKSEEELVICHTFINLTTEMSKADRPWVQQTVRGYSRVVLKLLRGPESVALEAPFAAGVEGVKAPTAMTLSAIRAEVETFIFCKLWSRYVIRVYVVSVL